MHNPLAGRVFKVTKTDDDKHIWAVDNNRQLEADEMLIVETSKGMNANAAFFHEFVGPVGDRPNLEHRGQVFTKLYNDAGNAFADIISVCAGYSITPSENFISRLTAPSGTWEPTRRDQLPAAAIGDEDPHGASKARRKAAKLAKKAAQPGEPTARTSAVKTKGHITVSSRINGTAAVYKLHPTGGTKGPLIQAELPLSSILVKAIGNSWWTLESDEGIVYVKEWKTEPSLVEDRA